MRFPHLCLFSLVAPLVTTAHAATMWWDGTSGAQAGAETTDPRDAHNWSTHGNWSNNSAGTGGGNDPDPADDAIFSNDGNNSSYVVHINNTDRTVNSLTFNGSGDIQIIRDNNPTNTASDSLLIGGGGITLGASAGAVTISETGGGQKVDVEVTADMSISNNSSSLLTFNRHMIGQGATGTRTITLDGSGAGGVTFNGQFQNGNSSIALVISTAANAITTLNAASSSPGLGGGVTLNSGTLSVFDPGAFGAGTLTLNGGRYATDGSDTTADVVIGGNILLGGETTETGGAGSGLDFTGTVDLNGGTRTLTNRRSVDFFDVVSNGGINITGTTSGHTTTFFADNMYEGDTIVSLGTLALSGSGAIDDVSAVNVVGSGATFDISGISASGETVGSLAGGSGSSVDIGGKNLTAGGNDASTTFAGDITGTGSLTKEGTGTMTLSGSNSYTGNTIITSGRLEIGNGGSSGSLGSGDIVNNSVLAFNRSNTYGVNNDISGTGSLELTAQAGSDSSINGTNSYEGGTTIFGGRFRVANDGNLGAVSSVLTLDGGSLKNNGGALSLDAGRSVILGSSGGGFQAGWTSDLTVNGVVSGSGGLTVDGDSGTLVLAGANTYTGDTAVTDANSSLKVTGSLGSGSTYAGEISGAGDVEFAGSGTQALTGTSTSHTGATTVSSGTLVVDGSLTSTITISSGATLGGSGTVGALTVDSGAFHNPGNSPGIMNTGDYTLSGSIIIEIEGNFPGVGGHDQVNVTGAVDITGGTLVDQFSSGSYVNGDMLFILANDGTDAITGTFAGLAQGATVTNFGGFDWQISYEADSVTSNFLGGNDIALMAVPEPNVVMLLGSLASLGLLRRRRD